MRDRRAGPGRSVLGALPWACPDIQNILGGFCPSPFCPPAVRGPVRAWPVPGAAPTLWGHVAVSVCHSQTFLFQGSTSDKRESTSSCLTTSSGSGNTTRYEIRSHGAAKIGIRRKQQHSERAVFTHPGRGGFLVAAAV